MFFLLVAVWGVFQITCMLCRCKEIGCPCNGISYIHGCKSLGFNLLILIIYVFCTTFCWTSKYVIIPVDIIQGIFTYMDLDSEPCTGRKDSVGLTYNNYITLWMLLFHQKLPKKHTNQSPFPTKKVDKCGSYKLKVLKDPNFATKWVCFQK